MQIYTDEELQIDSYLRKVTPSPLVSHLAYYTVEIYLHEHPHHNNYRSFLLSECCSIMNKLIDDVGINSRDLVCMYIYLVKYYYPHARMTSIAPHELIVFAAYHCIGTYYTEYISKEVWLPLIGYAYPDEKGNLPKGYLKAWYRFIDRSLTFAEEFDYRLLLSSIDLWINFNDLANPDKVLFLVSQFKSRSYDNSNLSDPSDKSTYTCTVVNDENVDTSNLPLLTSNHL